MEGLALWWEAAPKKTKILAFGGAVAVLVFLVLIAVG